VALPIPRLGKQTTSVRIYVGITNCITEFLDSNPSHAAVILKR